MVFRNFNNFQDISYQILRYWIYLRNNGPAIVIRSFNPLYSKKGLPVSYLCFDIRSLKSFEVYWYHNWVWDLLYESMTIPLHKIDQYDMKTRSSSIKIVEMRRSNVNETEKVRVHSGERIHFTVMHLMQCDLHLQNDISDFWNMHFEEFYVLLNLLAGHVVHSVANIQIWSTPWKVKGEADSTSFVILSLLYFLFTLVKPK